MNKARAFTLIELLVVVGIIGLLVAILLPSLNKARAQARRASCATQLHQVGVAMIAYMQDSHDRMPWISYLPSIGPGPLETTEPIYLADVLGRYFNGQAKQIKAPQDVLQCPDDKPGRTDRLAPNVGLSFFQSERSSYEYRISLAGLTPMQFNNRPHGVGWNPNPQPRNDDKSPPNSVWFARDYDNFHGKAGTIGSRRYAYIDGHVSDYEN